ncbi:GNAT family N-acetyltransferase [Aeromicrobium terrae]|uniref:GNAT family N-acetyltransferase n=1 Tax=Aeromicrobium terrae TaxID=2498846 RepID=A0A5C8NEJ3_9ACTN|nr:GNAT family protein [Aeromicrobium terrae]TXL57275.1 GNAT family N-acetyltransferase [Aeromicrobium terrae]
MPDALDGLELRRVRLEDASALAEAYRVNAEHLAPWEPRRSPDFFTDAGQRIEITRQLMAVENGLVEAWVVLEGDRVVARLNVNNIIRGVLLSASLGYWVAATHVGRGIAGAMVQHAIDRADDLGLHRLEAATLPENAASQAVLRRHEFVEFGRAPQMLYIAGEWQDQVLFQRILNDRPAGPAVP